MGPYDPFAEVEQTFVYFGSQKTFLSTNNMFYTRPVVNASGLHYFTDIQPQTTNTMRISQASDFAEEVETLQPMDQFAIYSTLSFPVSTDILPKVHSLWKNATSTLALAHPNITSVLTFQSIPPPPQVNAPQNSLGFAPGSTPHENIVLALFSFYWPDATDSTSVDSVAKSLVMSVQQLVGEEIKFKYLNYAAAWQDPIGSYGGGAA
ncbi:Uu.00g034800.m01.CDS01 [Anthostomella pinea]|uniref:Uu.00g034800.m01.CDS01 n=1 Tax=Anthostomella pinea TaxID=933095 RepID=A0AAI8YDE2_9PEZI|nr:Uu.00g034800.m01.CDS01 [Anthostomella pinea]